MNAISKRSFIFVLAIIGITNSAYTGMMYKPGEHRSLLIFVEQGESETPTKKRLDAITGEFILALEEKAAPILVSQKLLYNFVYRKQNFNEIADAENSFLNSIDFMQHTFNLYRIPYSQFYLIIPASHGVGYYQKNFNLKQLQKIDLPASAGQLNELVNTLDPLKNPQPAFAVKDFELLFSNNQDVVWDIYISGHGTKDQLICSLSLKDFQSVLRFFTNRTVIGVFIVSSCYAGGTNLSAISMEKEFGKENTSFFSKPNFITIVTNIEDSPSLVTSSNFNEIFSHAAKLADGDESDLKNLLKSLNTLTPSTSSIHAYANIPQIILPGGIFIQSLSPETSIQVIGIVNSKLKDIEKKDIEIRNKSNVLVYPNVIKAPINISPTFRSDISENIKSQQWNYLPTFNEFFRGNFRILNIEEVVSENDHSFPVLNNKISSLKSLKLDRLAREIFPNLISMSHGDSINRFLSINVIGSETQGIINFIRDSFHDINRRVTTKTFLIDKLTGPNDLSILLEAMRALRAFTDATKPENLMQSELEKEIQDKDTITLNKVIIQTKGIKSKNERSETISSVKTSVSFATEKNGWLFEFNREKVRKDDLLWNFKKIDIKQQTIRFESLQKTLPIPDLESQKSIPDIIKEQSQKIIPNQREIRIKKAEPSKIKLFQEAQKVAWSKLATLSELIEYSEPIAAKISQTEDELLKQQFPAIKNLIDSTPSLSLDDAEKYIKQGLMEEIDSIYKKIESIKNRGIEGSYKQSFKDFDKKFLPKISKDEITLKADKKTIEKYATEFTEKFNQSFIEFKKKQIEKYPNLETVINDKIPSKIEPALIIENTYKIIEKNTPNRALGILSKALQQPADYETARKSDTVILLKPKAENDYFLTWLTIQAKLILATTRLMHLSQTWLVDSITTNNDLLLFLELLRIIFNVTAPQGLETALQPYVGKQITLQNVMLKAENTMFNNDQNQPDNKWSLVLGFTLDGNSWICSNSGTSQAVKSDSWQFKKIDVDTWAAQYASVKKSLDSKPDKTKPLSQNIPTADVSGKEQNQALTVPPVVSTQTQSITPEEDLKQRILNLAQAAGLVLGYGGIVKKIQTVLDKNGISQGALKEIYELVRTNESYPSFIEPSKEDLERNEREMKAYSDLKKLLAEKIR